VPKVAVETIESQVVVRLIDVPDHFQGDILGYAKLQASRGGLDPSFGTAVGGPINQFHGCKATTVTALGWFEAFVGRIHAGLRAAKDGTAFAPTKETANA
jgi:hypothetical protein